jgi:hypothetical protein
MDLGSGRTALARATISAPGRGHGARVRLPVSRRETDQTAPKAADAPETASGSSLRGNRFAPLEIGA